MSPVRTMASKLQTKRKVSKPLTYEEFLTLTEGEHAEWVDGEVLLLMPASQIHQNLADFLLTLLRFFVEHHGLGKVLSAPFQMKTGESLPGREPDALFVAKENLSRLRLNHLEGPADLVIEVVCPESRERDRGAKFYEYEAGGVKEYWLIDPQRKQAEFYQLNADGVYQLVSPNEQGVYFSRVVPGLWIKVSWVWEETMPPLKTVLQAWQLI